MTITKKEEGRKWEESTEQMSKWAIQWRRLYNTYCCTLYSLRALIKFFPVAVLILAVIVHLKYQLFH